MEYNSTHRVRRLYFRLKTSVLSLVSPHLFSNEVKPILFIPFGKKKEKYNLDRHYFSLAIKCKDDVYKYLFFFLMLALLVVIPVMSLRVGISERDIVLHENAEKVFRYYSENDREVFAVPTLPYQGQIIDVAAVCLMKLFAVDDPFILRHLISSYFGWLTLLVTGLFLLRILYWRAAFLGALFLFISPRFLGHSFYNTIDIPFTFAYVWSVFNIYLFCKELPEIRWSRIVWLVLSLFLAVSISIAGYILFFYLFLFVLGYFFFHNPIPRLRSQPYWRALLKVVTVLLSITLAVFILNLFYLPVDSVTPFFRPVFAIRSLLELFPSSSYLYDGDFVSATELPRYYLLKYIFMTVPLVVLLGFVLHWFVLKFILEKGSLSTFFILVFSLYFPILTAMLSGVNPPNDWSPFYFVYPLIIIWSVAGFETILVRIDDRYTNAVILGVICLLSLMPVRHIIINHPLTYVYFNEISGGIGNAYGKYELDYENLVNKKASEWLVEYIHDNENTGIDSCKVPVITNGNRGCFYFFNDYSHIPLYQIENTLTDSINGPFYYMIFLSNIRHDVSAEDILFLEDAFHTVTLEGKPLVFFIKVREE